MNGSLLAITATVTFIGGCLVGMFIFVFILGIGTLDLDKNNEKDIPMVYFNDTCVIYNDVITLNCLVINDKQVVNSKLHIQLCDTITTQYLYSDGYYQLPLLDLLCYRYLKGKLNKIE